MVERVSERARVAPRGLRDERMIRGHEWHACAISKHLLGCGGGVGLEQSATDGEDRVAEAERAEQPGPSRCDLRGEGAPYSVNALGVDDPGGQHVEKEGGGSHAGNDGALHRALLGGEPAGAEGRPCEGGWRPTDGSAPSVGRVASTHQRPPVMKGI